MMNKENLIVLSLLIGAISSGVTIYKFFQEKQGGYNLI
jgi:hypothetical protein